MLFAWLTGRDDRRNSAAMARARQEHERRLARDDRIYADVRGAYAALLPFVHRMQATVSAVFPFREKLGDVPEEVAPEELREMTARVSTVASEGVHEAMDNLFECWEAFMSRVAAMPSKQADPIKATEILQPLADESHASVTSVRRLIAAEVRGEV